ncbi:hypothetical protein [Mucilaginibacter gotjawali]|uniref:Uncharacterized protein n=2 Tax=Mucilaginibacter gotjawali TaxID=1550579 RepID=A0A0X8X038_9SPHI|nr:hypothetical protein [Mucilaginibacter gotjawali]MBB3055323.1 putative membrane protein [Mucilaginibacter gotjawali]BAU53400.1 hypothetical protein MgSA37_01568 [Mucilaginibacter gotjawali]
MKKFSILLFILGVIVTIGLIIYYKSVVNVVDSDSMTISPSGDMVAKWPIFVGIIMVFVGGVFFYISKYGKKID